MGWPAPPQHALTGAPLSSSARWKRCAPPSALPGRQRTRTAIGVRSRWRGPRWESKRMPRRIPLGARCRWTKRSPWRWPSSTNSLDALGHRLDLRNAHDQRPSAVISRWPNSGRANQLLDGLKQLIQTERLEEVAITTPDYPLGFGLLQELLRGRGQDHRNFPRCGLMS